METVKIGELYQKIAEYLNEMIPSQWEKIVYMLKYLMTQRIYTFILQRK